MVRMKLWLAPLHGITYYGFRNCFIKHFQGIDAAIAPFIAAQPKEKFNPKKIQDLFPENNKSIIVIPQIMGNIPQNILETVNVLTETYGYKQFNWNIGCPMNTIVRKKRGCGIMPYVDLIEEVVNEVCGKSTVSFSLKMRLGLSTPDEGLDILQRIAPYPIDFLCIHPRLGVQLYNGTVNLDVFESFYHLTNHKIVYSGDIDSLPFFMQLKNRFPKIEHWMLGRGILKNPFLAEEISTQERLDFSLLKTRFIVFYNEYSELLLNLKNEKIALSSLKELWHYFAAFWKLDALELRELLRINEYHLFQKKVRESVTF